MKILALDPSFANTGWVLANMTDDGSIVSISGGLICTEKTTVKTTRRSSDDFRRAKELAMGLRMLAEQAQIVFAEIPSGTQSARASWALGVCLGVLTNVHPKTLVEVTPTQTKLAALGRKDATKPEMIEWASSKRSDLPWKYNRGKLSPTNEHMADALGVLYAGLSHEDYQNYLGILRHLKP